MQNAVVLLNYNDSDRIIGLTKKLLSFNKFKIIVIVDNNSCKDQIDALWCLDEYEEVKILSSKVNLGYSGGNNLGLNWLKCQSIDNVFLLNSDVDLEPELICQCEAFLAEHTEISIVTAKMIEYGEEKQYYYEFPSVSSVIKDNLGLTKLFKTKPRIKKDYTDYFTVDYPRSSFWAVRYKDFEDVGFFDEKTFLYYVETCVALKLRSSDKQCAVLKNYNYLHNHIYRKGYKINGYKDAYKSLIYIFKTYYKTSTFKFFMLSLSYRLGLMLRLIFRHV